MNQDLLRLLVTTGTVGSISVAGIQVLLKRMAGRETQALTAKTDADATETLMRTWMTAVLAPIQQMAQEATARANQASGEVRAIRTELDGVHREMALVEGAIRDHQPWDQAAATQIRQLGGDIGEPPPLRLPPI